MTEPLGARVTRCGGPFPGLLQGRCSSGRATAFTHKWASREALCRPCCRPLPPGEPAVLTKVLDNLFGPFWKEVEKSLLDSFILETGFQVR